MSPLRQPVTDPRAQEYLVTNIQQPSARYILPEFRERTANGERMHNPYTKLFEERIIFLGVQIDDASADDVMAQLLTLESIDPDRDISICVFFIRTIEYWFTGKSSMRRMNVAITIATP